MDGEEGRFGSDGVTENGTNVEMERIREKGGLRRTGRNGR